MEAKREAIADTNPGQVRSAVYPHLAPVQTDIEAVRGLVAVPEIDIVVFAEDSVLSGRIRLSSDRVSDLLNDHVEYAVTDAVLEDLVDGHTVACEELLLQRDELIVVDATGPRGNAARRRRMHQHPIIAKAGPYEVFGYLHAAPGIDPIASLRRRKPIVAITDAVIGYSFESMPRLRWANVVMLNRECVDWIAKAPDDALALDLPPGPIGRLTKDYTGALYH